MTRGRRPVPTSLKILRGNPGKRPLNQDEPNPSVVRLSPPKELDDLARKEWRRMAKELYKLGLLTTIDRAAFAGYCQSWALWIQALDKVRTLGAIVKAPTGFPIQNPYLSVANQAQKQMRAFLVEFGMTPASRARVHGTPPAATAKDDPWAEVG